MQNLNENKSTIPKYLEELVKPTPLSVEKLLAAWDGLSFETQLMILSEYVSTYPEKYQKIICLVSSSSKNEYVRIVSRNISEFIQEIKDIAKDDSSILVSSKYYCPKGWIPLSDNPIYNPELFFNLNQTERLIIVSSINGYAEKVCEIIKYFYKNKIELKKVSEEDLFDILNEYLNNKHFKKYKWEEKFIDFSPVYGNDGVISEFWNLIPLVSENIAYLLLENLPVHSGSYYLEESKILNLQDKYIIVFFKNRNLKAVNLRKIFFGSKLVSDEVRKSAVLYNLSIDDFEFLKILQDDSDKRNKMLNALIFAEDNDICVKMATIDFIKIESSIDWVFVRMINQLIRNKIDSMCQSSKRNQLNLIRIYEIAKRIKPWDGSIGKNGFFPEKLNCFNIETKGLNTWQVYIKLKDRLEWAGFNDKSLLFRLESFFGIDEDNESEINDSSHIIIEMLDENRVELFNHITKLDIGSDLKIAKEDVLLKMNSNNNNVEFMMDRIKGLETALLSVKTTIWLLIVLILIICAFRSLSFIAK